MSLLQKATTSENTLGNMVRVIEETNAVPRPLLGRSYLPRFIHTPHVEMTKELICGVDCDEVYPGIFVGDEGAARNTDFLMTVGITHVLNTAEGSGFGQVSTGSHYYSATGIKYLGFRLMDLPMTKINKYFNEGTQFIENALSSGGKVLVHCLMGISRSSSFVVAYLIMKKSMTVEEALRMICHQRECRPNDGFLVQLLQQQKNN